MGDSMGRVGSDGTYPGTEDFVLLKWGVICWIFVSSFSKAVSLVATRFVTSSTFLILSLMPSNLYVTASSSSKYWTLITLVTRENWVASRPSVLSKRETWLPLCKTLSRNAKTSPHTAAKAQDFQAGTALASTLYWKTNIQYYAVSQYPLLNLSIMFIPFLSTTTFVTDDFDNTADN